MVGNKCSIGRSHKVLLCYAVFFVLRIISICNLLIVSSKDQAQIQSHVWSPVCGGENWRKARPVSRGRRWAGLDTPPGHHFSSSGLVLTPALGFPLVSPLVLLWAEVVEATEQESGSETTFSSSCPSLLMVKRMDWPLSELRVIGGMDLESNLAA